MESVAITGTRLDRTFAINEVDCNGEQSMVDYVWNKIADWVCGTQVNEAKALLEKLCHPEKAIFKGLQPAGLNFINRHNFSKLQALVGADYKNNFKEVINPLDDTTDYQLVIDGKTIFSTADLATKCEAVFYSLNK